VFPLKLTAPSLTLTSSSWQTHSIADDIWHPPQRPLQLPVTAQRDISFVLYRLLFLISSTSSQPGHLASATSSEEGDQGPWAHSLCASICCFRLTRIFPPSTHVSDNRHGECFRSPARLGSSRTSGSLFCLGFQRLYRCCRPMDYHVTLWEAFPTVWYWPCMSGSVCLVPISGMTF
jgi:hypothetical protein